MDIKVDLADKTGKILIPLFPPPAGYTIHYDERFRNGLIRAHFTKQKIEELKKASGDQRLPNIFWGYMDRYGRAYFKD